MRSIAERRLRRVLALAHRIRPLLGNRHLDRREFGTFMRTVAPRLFLRFPAPAPPVTSRFEFNHRGSAFRNRGFGHVRSLLVPMTSSRHNGRTRQAISRHGEGPISPIVPLSGRRRSPSAVRPKRPILSRRSHRSFPRSARHCGTMDLGQRQWWSGPKRGGAP